MATHPAFTGSKLTTYLPEECVKPVFIDVNLKQISRIVLVFG